MFDFFKRKRCPQCGEELRMFKKVKYCSLNCAAIAKSLDKSKDGYGALYDILYAILKREPTHLEIVKYYMEVPEYIHNEAASWGWDTEVRDKCYVYLKGEIENVQ